MLNTNTHIHTPYSFCPFETMEQLVAAAKEESIAALGINDIATCEGFGEFAALCERFKIYPLFNIEFLVRSDDLPVQKVISNTPLGNDGYLFICGKALDYPLTLSPDSHNLLISSWKKTQDYIWDLVDKTNEHLKKSEIDITLDYNDIRKRYAKRNVLERHMVKALYDALVRRYDTPQKLEAALMRIAGGSASTGRPVEPRFTQITLYRWLLDIDRGIASTAFKDQYMRFREAYTLILNAGGVPCYSIGGIPANKISECESGAHRLADFLQRARIFAVDIFPLRTELELLKTYVSVLSQRNFCVTFGTGHNTPERPPFVPALYGNQPLDQDLTKTGWEGACILAAHQEAHKRNKMGYVNNQGELQVDQKNRMDFIALGAKAIREASGQ
ncbi:MAG: PHP domain-containing protein [Chitinispirillaceae bacterium]|nr:PHP domain-containing protein [Chitinispirillaceae bacterium]